MVGGFFSKHTVDWVINCMGVYLGDGYTQVMEGNLFDPMQIILQAAEKGVRNFINMNTSLPAYFIGTAFVKISWDVLEGFVILFIM